VLELKAAFNDVSCRLDMLGLATWRGMRPIPKSSGPKVSKAESSAPPRWTGRGLGCRRQCLLAAVAAIVLLQHAIVAAAQAPDHHADPYETLHVSKDADVNAIKHAYHDVADALLTSDEVKLAEVVEAYQEVLDAAYAQEQSMTYETYEGAAGVNVAVSNDAALGHMVGGGGYGLLAMGAVSEGGGGGGGGGSGGGSLATGPRLCMVMYASQKWRWGLRWDSPYSVVGGGEDRGRGVGFQHFSPRYYFAAKTRSN
jgi:hypothetical protein